MTPVFCCGFECGVDTSHWFTVTGTSYSTTTVRTGARSLRVNPTAASNAVNSPTLASSTRWIGRIYIQFATLPSADVDLVSVGTTAGGPQVRFKQSDSKLYAAVSSTFGASGVAVTTGQWYLIDFDFNISTGGNDLCDIQVNGTACGQATAAGLSAAQTRLTIGNIGANATMDVFFEDCVLSQTAADYPIGAGKVLALSPGSDGTHTFTTTIGVRGTTGAPTGGGNIASSTDSFNWLNAKPIGGGATDNTRLWNQQSNGSTLYGEVKFESSGEANAPRAVEVLIVRRDAGTGVGDSTFKISDNGTESTVFATGAVAGIASDNYHTKQFATPPSGGSWNMNASGNGSFPNLRFRFGYSADANPDHYCRGVMIEAEFAGATPLTQTLSDDLNA